MKSTRVLLWLDQDRNVSQQLGHAVYGHFQSSKGFKQGQSYSVTVSEYSFNGIPKVSCNTAACLLLALNSVQKNQAILEFLNENHMCLNESNSFGSIKCGMIVGVLRRVVLKSRV